MEIHVKMLLMFWKIFSLVSHIFRLKKLNTDNVILVNIRLNLVQLSPYELNPFVEEIKLKCDPRLVKYVFFTLLSLWKFYSCSLTCCTSYLWVIHFNNAAHPSRSLRMFCSFFSFTASLRRGVACVQKPVKASERRRLQASCGMYCLCHMPLLSLITWCVLPRRQKMSCETIRVRMSVCQGSFTVKGDLNGSAAIIEQMYVSVERCRGVTEVLLD